MEDLSEFDNYKPDLWVIDIIDWILNPCNGDQRPEGKSKFVKIAKVGSVTRLSAVGKSNVLMRKKSKEFSWFAPDIEYQDKYLRIGQIVEYITEQADKKVA